MKSLGLRHLALNVSSAEKSKEFYVSLFGMSVEWQPEPGDVFLTSNGQDNLALHERKDLVVLRGNNHQSLDHLGFVMASKDDVREVREKVRAMNVEVVQDLKQHRDGAYSFYCKDPDGYIVQVIYHPPISDSRL